MKTHGTVEEFNATKKVSALYGKVDQLNCDIFENPCTKNSLVDTRGNAQAVEHSHSSMH